MRPRYGHVMRGAWARLALAVLLVLLAMLGWLADGRQP